MTFILSIPIPHIIINLLKVKDIFTGVVDGATGILSNTFNSATGSVGGLIDGLPLPLLRKKRGLMDGVTGTVGGEQDNEASLRPSFTGLLNGVTDTVGHTVGDLTDTLGDVTGSLHLRKKRGVGALESTLGGVGGIFLEYS